MIMKLTNALAEQRSAKMFRIVDSEDLDLEDFPEWTVAPVAGEVLEEENGFFVVRAVQVLESGEEIDCFIDLTMPERIPDHAYFVRSGAVERESFHECRGEVICAVPIDGFGQYDLFYSRTKPESGISVLRRGLEHATRTTFIAEDLGYILRDEERLNEAIEAFRLSASGEPSSSFIFLELADLYDQVGQPELAEEFRAKCPNPTQPQSPRPWWKSWKR